MRRAELSVHDGSLYTELAGICGEGYLCLITGDGYPRNLAVNFAAVGQTLFFHGARAGEKFTRVQEDPRVGFSMIQALSFLPSTWSSLDLACPATQLFRSVEVKGRCVVLEDPDEIAAGLEALMRKYQPEGGYSPIAPDAFGYRQSLKSVAVFRLDPDSWTGKVKLLQNLPEVARRRIMNHLADRGAELDLLTLDLMRRYSN
jgi:nitroimidazol reductase NimA-like FMN-containing flavoprotein (pyridoxamine 5'-phosphate oxidase superfamily)